MDFFCYNSHGNTLVQEFHRWKRMDLKIHPRAAYSNLRVSRNFVCYSRIWNSVPCSLTSNGIIIIIIVERGDAAFSYWKLSLLLLLLLLNVVTRRILIGKYYYVSLLLLHVGTRRIHDHKTAIVYYYCSHCSSRVILGVWLKLHTSCEISVYLSGGMP